MTSTLQVPPPSEADVRLAHRHVLAFWRRDPGVQERLAYAAARATPEAKLLADSRTQEVLQELLPELRQEVERWLLAQAESPAHASHLAEGYRDMVGSPLRTLLIHRLREACQEEH